MESGEKVETVTQRQQHDKKPEEVQEERWTVIDATELQQFNTISKQEETDANQLMLFSVEMANCSDVNLELQQVLMDLESAVWDRRRKRSLSVGRVDQYTEGLIQPVEQVEGALATDSPPSVCEERGRWEKELGGLQEENQRLQLKLSSEDEEQSHTRAAVGSTQDERDRLRYCLRELQTRIPSVGSDGGQVTFRCLTSAEQLTNPNTGNWSNRKINSSAKGFTAPDDKIQEFQVETERLNSRMEHLKSQNDLLTITLEECKSNTERMSKLVARYQSNATALRLSLHYSEQCVKAYELLLTECEQNLVPPLGPLEEEGCEQNVPLRGAAAAASTIALSTNTSSSDCKQEEQRLKHHIEQLKSERAALELQILTPETPNTPTSDLKAHPDSHRLELENAVLMQELMAMKEELAEMKARLYLLEKEKKSLELKLSTQETCEQTFLVQIEHLKSELEEQQEQRRNSHNLTGGSSKCAQDSSVIPQVSELKGISDSDPAAELTTVLQKEMKLKVRVKVLLAALEKLSKCSEIRNQQTATFVCDFKQANSNLVTAYEKAKKKHQNKLKKLETQMMSMVERQETEVCRLKQRIRLLEAEISHLHTSETSL